MRERDVCKLFSTTTAHSLTAIMFVVDMFWWINVMLLIMNLPFIFSEKCPVFGHVKLKLLNNYSMWHHFEHLHIATKDCSSYCDYNTITNQAGIMAVCHEHTLQSRFIFKQHTTKTHAAEACDISHDHIWLTSHLKIKHFFITWQLA